MGFKAGELVKCVNVGESSFLTLGRTYTVVNDTSDEFDFVTVSVGGTSFLCYKNCFESLPFSIGDYVRCVDKGYCEFLEKKVVDVYSGGDMLEVISDDGVVRAYRAKRFQQSMLDAIRFKPERNFRIRGAACEVYVNDYVTGEGELANCFGYWRGGVKSHNTLLALIDDICAYDSNFKAHEFDSWIDDDGEIELHTSVLVDKDSCRVSHETQIYKDWVAGKAVLYTLRTTFYIEVFQALRAVDSDLTGVTLIEERG